ncbi:hypothetical protein ACSZN0_22215, partial [Aeromonas caviae]
QPGLNGLTSGGQPTHYQVNGNVITLLDAGGKTILTVTLGLDGKYQVVLDGVLDQPVSTNSVNLGLQVQGTDFDGDKSNLGTLNIHITDGVLPQVDPVSLTLVEDSDWSAAQTLSGDLNITAGTDPLANIGFDASQPGLQGLTSGGQPVVITISGNSISHRQRPERLHVDAGSERSLCLHLEPAAGSGECRQSAQGGLYPHRQ